MASLAETGIDSGEAEDLAVPDVIPEPAAVSTRSIRSFFRIEGSRLVACDPAEAQVIVYNSPTIDDEAELQELYNIDFHTLQSSLDPDELSRLEFETDHAAIIFKRPKSFCADDNFLLKLTSTGVFVYEDHLVIVMSDDAPVFEGRVPFQVQSIQDVILRLIYQATLHFEGHLKAINMLSDSLERRISTSLENRYLINMFALEKSLVYIVNSISSNGALLERMKTAAEKLGLDRDQVGILEDLIIENQQCYKRAEIHSQVIGGMMDARASIVSHNLNQLIKKFTIWTVAIMLANLVVGIFSMNVHLPIPMEDHWWPFWLINVLALLAGGFVFWLWRVKKW
ncbi:MAG TPA: magnesium transporter CorA family protein [Terrimicrobiaceae bacterium]|nr:magnesium transporter CorA family protein [Terrimicrobiaceae bacterium]